MLAELDNIELNDRQRAIVDHIQGGLQVMAPVGTGKTLVLAERAANAIREGIDPHRILCMTFTNRAAKEMQERIRRIFPKDADKITVSTFHALCASILRMEANEIGLPRDFMVYDEVDSIDLIQEIKQVENQEAKGIYNRIVSLKAGSEGNLISAGGILQDLFNELPEAIASTAIEYQHALQMRHALDFQDLVVFTWALLRENAEAKERWQERFEFIQVDEVQDTHISEYRIVKELSAKSGNLALIGDFDQTIYEWRGSQPQRVMESFKRDFAPVSTMTLGINYRATRRLLETSMKFAESFDHRTVTCFPSEEVEEGTPIQVLMTQDEASEGRKIGEVIARMYQENRDLNLNQIGILTRTNRRGAVISQVLAGMDIPHVTVEQYEFFRRQEIKDVLAHLRLLLNPHDIGSLLRVLQRPPKGIGEVSIHRVLTEGKEIGLRLTDMIDAKTLQYGEPYGALLEAMESGSICVVDVETTGLDFGSDEVIEIAGVKITNGEIDDEFHEYLRNSVPVGNSESVHGYSDSFLATNGIQPIEGLERFFDWMQGSLIVGHNISFDQGIIESQAARLNLTAPEFIAYDTLNIAHNYLLLPRYRLSDVANHLEVSTAPTHQALDDARCTAEVLLKLISLLRRDRLLRKSLVSKLGKAFQPLTIKISDWRKRLATARPSEILTFVLTDSGLAEFYADQQSRLENLEQLREVFSVRDDLKLHPQIALQEVVKFCALAKNVDFLSETDNRVPIITIHQSKGLEFDTVFLAGAVDGEFPNYYAVQDGKLEEEKRVFYVGMTRAKRQLYITGFRKNARGWTIPQSQFIVLLGRENIEFNSN